MSQRMGVQRSAAALVILTLAGTLLSGCQGGPAPEAGRKPAATSQGPIEIGKHLVTILGCIDCHTPLQMGPKGPEPDMTRLLSGHPEAMKMPAPPKLGDGPWVWVGAATNTAFAGPWGVSYSANLTPDQNTGMGIWTEEMFVTALRQGKHMGTSRDIQPPMPWRWYGEMSDDELKAIFAYLKSIPAITNHVPDYEPPGGSGD